MPSRPYVRLVGAAALVAGAGVLAEIEIVERKTHYVGETKIGKRKYRIEVDADGVLLNKEFIGDED